MDCRLPPLAPRWSKTVRVTLDILRQRPLAEALSEGLADLAAQFEADPADRIYVRIPIGSGWLEGWYSPRERELEPIAWQSPSDAA